jgi:hypothetical protein
MRGKVVGIDFQGLFELFARLFVHFLFQINPAQVEMRELVTAVPLGLYGLL